jgi:hypothetical protein
MFKGILLMFVMCLPAFPTCAEVDLDGWGIVQISAADRVAVAKSPAGELRLVREGDQLGEHATVTGFDGGGMTLEQPGEWGRTTLFVRIDNGRQQVARRERQPLRKSDVAGERAAVTSNQ